MQNVPDYTSLQIFVDKNVVYSHSFVVKNVLMLYTSFKLALRFTAGHHFRLAKLSF